MTGITPSRWRQQLGRLLAFLDVLVIAVASWVAYEIRITLAEAGTLQPFPDVLPLVVGVLPLWLLIFYFVGAYRPEYLNTGADAFRRFSAGVVGGVLAVGFSSFAFRLLVPRVYVLLLTLLVFVLGGLTRVLLRRYLVRQRAAGKFSQGFLVVGVDAEAIATARSLDSDPLAGYRLLGYLTDNVPVGRSIDGRHEVVGTPGQVLDCADRLGAGMVLVSPNGLPAGTLRSLTVQLEGSPVDLAVAPSLFEVVSRRVLVETVGNVPILHVQQVRLTTGKAFLKRTLDLVAATTLFVTSLPVAILAALAIRLDSRGPILFQQRRIGKDGHYFTVLKFRTMRANAEADLDALRDFNEVGDPDALFFKVKDDPRITRVGRFLRAWSVDELPQLWNVIRGDMSMVGPRPLPGDVETWEPWQLRRLRVRPGITGVWQVSGRSYVDTDEAVRMDIFYIENWSLGWDLLIMVQTIGAILRREGAH